MSAPGKGKKVSVEEAAALLRARDTLALPLGPGQPAALLHALGEREDFERLVVFTALLTDLYAVFTRPGVRLLSGFFGPVERGLLAAGCDVEFVPADFRRFAAIAARMKPRVMATAAAPPDENGAMSLSLHAGATVAALAECAADPDRILIVETNPALPRTCGLPPEHPHLIRVEDADYIVESDRPVFTVEDPDTTELERAMAAHAAGFIESGCTLQIGIGGVPNEFADMLADGGLEDLGIHTEMFTTGLMRLHRAGKVSNRKGLFDGFSVTTFAAGTAELYGWLDGNHEVRFLPASVVNNPAMIARNRKMISINSALTVDLGGQVAADTIGARQYSGIGGHHDFTAAATRAEGGRALICLPSTAEVDGRRVSRIVASMPAGTMVTTPRYDVDVVITEHGAAELAGRSALRRAEELIAIAHPDFRAELRKSWRALHGDGGG